MKRSEMINKLEELLSTHDVINEYATQYGIMLLAIDILNKLEEEGMLPPVNRSRIILDTNGNARHSESKREWDDETTIC